jgi:RNA polymerase sigma-70 factor (ECF subfamily)
MVMWRKFETYEPDTNFAAWALHIARLEVMNFRRRATPQQRLFDDELFDQIADEALVVNNTLPDARLDALRECLQKLPEESRRLIGMFYEQEMPVAKIAAAIDRSDKTIYRLIANIHQMLLACVRRTMAEL